MRHMSDVTARPGRRPGFTLVELLVVVGIISILASLALTGVMKLRAAQLKNFTEVTIGKLASALDQQWRATLDDVKDEAPDLARFSGAMQLAGGEVRRARVIYSKMKLKARFPNTFAGALNPDLGSPKIVPPEQVFVRELTGVSAVIDDAANTPAGADLQSSILLFMSLGQARRGMAAFSPSELDPSAIATVDLKLTGQPGKKTFSYFKDAWDQPIRFYMFPTGCQELNEGPHVNPAEAAARMKARDPLDPEGTLYVDAVQWPDVLRNQFQQRVHTLQSRQGTPIAQHLVPVIASAGADGKWGVDDMQMAGPVSGDAGDNIYSFRLRRAGARGD